MSALAAPREARGALDEVAACRAAMVAIASLHAACLLLCVAWPRRLGGRAGRG